MIIMTRIGLKKGGPLHPQQTLQGDESPDVARMFCTKDHGAQISG